MTMKTTMININEAKTHLSRFDRLLVAQALEHRLTLITPDPLIRQYDVPTLWL